MAEDMKKRAGIALNNSLVAIGLAPFRDEIAAALASAALLAALDPEDEALVSEVAHAIGLMDYFGEEPMPTPTAPALRVTRDRIEHFSFLARAALVALKQRAQGVQPVRSDMREKD